MSDRNQWRAIETVDELGGDGLRDAGLAAASRAIDDAQHDVDGAARVTVTITEVGPEEEDG